MDGSADLTAVDLDRAEAEILGRWFVWTAAGLTVDPVTRVDHDRRPGAALAGRSGVTTNPSLSLRVSRPDAHADIVVSADGWTDLAIRRPGADDVTHATAHVESVDAFASVLDRVVELITWSGGPNDRRGSAPDLSVVPQRAAHWVCGFDGLALSNEP